MSGRRVYIAGPMTGLPDWNRSAFTAAASMLREAGLTPVNPAEIVPHAHDGPCPDSYAVADDGHSSACYLRVAFQWLLSCDEVCLLPGWETSTGAGRERELADWAGIPVSVIDPAALRGDTQ